MFLGYVDSAGNLQAKNRTSYRSPPRSEQAAFWWSYSASVALQIKHLLGKTHICWFFEACFILLDMSCWCQCSSVNRHRCPSLWIFCCHAGRDLIAVIVSCLWCGVARGSCRSLGLSYAERGRAFLIRIDAGSIVVVFWVGLSFAESDEPTVIHV